jgi:hypothetical protein
MKVGPGGCRRTPRGKGAKGAKVTSLALLALLALFRRSHGWSRLKRETSDPWADLEIPASLRREVDALKNQQREGE